LAGSTGSVECPFCGHVLERPYRHLVAKYRSRRPGRYLAVYRCPACGKRFTISRRRVKRMLRDEDGEVDFKIILRPVSGEVEIYLVRYE